MSQAFYDQFAAAILNPDIVPPVKTAQDHARFDVYRNNVVTGLVDTLSETFPVTTRVLGDTFFRAMAVEFVRASPPRSPQLLRYGDLLPDFIDRFPPAASVPYAADLARLEWACREAYYAADAESLTLTELAAMDQTALLTADFAIHPSVRCLSSAHPIVSMWKANQVGSDGRLPVTLRTAEQALVVRHQDHVHVHLLSPDVGQFFRHLQNGQTFSTAIERSDSEDSFDPGAALIDLINLGVFTNFK